MISLTVSEAFDSNASYGRVGLDTNGPVSGVGYNGPNELKIVYDEPSGAYRIYSQSGSSTADIDVTFAPSDLLEDSDLGRVFGRSEGNASESLLLTNPGTSGSLTYRYVGTGLYKRSVSYNTNTDISIFAVTYGVESPDDAIPRRGAAGYAIDVLGIRTLEGEAQPLTMRGAGTFLADFSRDLFELEADYLLYREDGSRFSSAAKDGVISIDNWLDGYLSGNAFAGSGLVHDSEYMFVDTWGRFYGPDREEVGGSFAGYQGTSAAPLAVFGTFMGRQDASIPLPSGRIVDLDEETTFASSLNGFTFDNARGARSNFQRTELVTASLVTFDPNAGRFEDDPYAGRYDFEAVSGTNDFGGVGSFSVGPDDFWDWGTIWRYEKLVDGRQVNVEINRGYTYSRYARILNSGNPLDPSIGGSEQLIGFGRRTAQGELPVSGTGSYQGSANGSAVSGEDNFYRLSGLAAFNVDFGSALIDGTIDATLYSTTSEPNIVLDPLLFTGTIADAGADGDFAGTFSGLSGSTGVGHFFGPEAQELILNFSADIVGATPADSFQVEGLAIAAEQ